MAEKYLATARQKRKTSPGNENLHKNEAAIMKQPKVKRKKTSNINLCQRFSKAIEDVLVVSKNETFRNDCFRMLGVENGSDAGSKIQELATELKGTKYHDESKEDNHKRKKNQ